MGRRGIRHKNECDLMLFGTLWDVELRGELEKNGVLKRTIRGG